MLDLARAFCLVFFDRLRLVTGERASGLSYLSVSAYFFLGGLYGIGDSVCVPAGMGSDHRNPQLSPCGYNLSMRSPSGKVGDSKYRSLSPMRGQ